jgi:hypothetical protein
MIPHWARLTAFVGRLSLRYRFRETGASKVGFQQDWLSQKQERICRGTEGSNPFPSRRESTANLTTTSNRVGYIASVQLLIRR